MWKMLSHDAYGLSDDAMRVRDVLSRIDDALGEEERAMPTPIPIKTNLPVVVHMSFGAAMDAAVDGSKVRRDSWPDDVYLMLSNGVICIHKPIKADMLPEEHWDGLLWALRVSDGDICGDDWVIVA